MGQPALEVADIFRIHGPAWRAAQRGHLSLGQLKVMSAIEQCRSAALGGHVLRCGGCGADQIAYNSCRNRHCPKCQSSAAQRWLDARQADLLPVEYYHVVFTLPAPIADIAYQNKAVVYGLLFDVAAEVLLTIAADPKHLGARIGATLVLHTWGSALTHHPHVHGIVPGGGLAPDGKTWVACRPGFFLSVRVLSRLFRRRFLEELLRVHQAGKLQFFGEHAALADAKAFKAWLAPLRTVRVGRLRQAPVRRAAGGAGLPVALHAPGGDLQQPAARHGRARRHLPLEGLPRQGRRQGQVAPQDDDAGARASSCAASCCTCCPAASIASATTGCWPTAAARPVWRWRARCWPARAAPIAAADAADTGIDRARPASSARTAAHAMIIAADLRARRVDPRTARPQRCHDRTSCSHRLAGFAHERRQARPCLAAAARVSARRSSPANQPDASAPSTADSSHGAAAPAQRPIAGTRAAHYRHSAVATSDHRGTGRGFLPRGLSNTCPQSVPCAASCFARAGVEQTLTKAVTHGQQLRGGPTSALTCLTGSSERQT